MFNRDYGIILACDVTSLEEAKEIAQLSTEFEEVVGIKIGFSLALRFGLKKVVDTIKNINSIPIIYDHQKAGTDIPQMGEAFSICCKEANIDGVIIFPQAGPSTLDSFLTAIIQNNMTPIVGAVMTHKNYLSSDGGFINDDAPEKIFSTALSKDVQHFVLPGNKPELIRTYSEIIKLKPNTSILMPGIGSQGGDLKIAFSSCLGLNAYAIIGSAIYKSSNPVIALKSFIDDLKSYLNQ